MTAAMVTVPSKPRAVKVADDAYADAVIGELLARLREVSAATSEPLEAVLGPVAMLAARVTAAVPGTSRLAAAVGPVYRQAGLAKACGCSRQAVSDWVRSRRLLALTTADDVVLIPAFQLDRHLRPIRGLEKVLRVLTSDVVDDWTLASWLRAPQPILDGDTVVDRLAAGDVGAAVSTAEAARRRWLR